MDPPGCRNWTSVSTDDSSSSSVRLASTSCAEMGELRVPQGVHDDMGAGVERVVDALVDPSRGDEVAGETERAER